MSVSLNFHPPTLIQSVRAMHAVMEAGIPVSIGKGHKAIFDYLKAFFEVKYTLTPAPAADASLLHKTPFVRIGKEQRPLLYPHAIFDKSKAFWSDKREGTIFIGFIPPHREPAMQEWHGRAEIEHTNVGRKSLRRFWDESYFRRLGRAEFGLCPDGGWPWSHRFFDCALTGTTPIVQTECDIYKGFYYHKWNDKGFVRRDVAYNFQRALDLLTMPHETILKNL
jgi:hypothetical protein